MLSELHQSSDPTTAVWPHYSSFPLDLSGFLGPMPLTWIISDILIISGETNTMKTWAWQASNPSNHMVLCDHRGFSETTLGFRSLTHKMRVMIAVLRKLL